VGRAKTESYGTVFVTTPVDPEQRAQFIADICNLTVHPDVPARVVINERTGTVVIGGNVRLSNVAISHGSLSVTTAETPEVSQPLPFSQGETAVVPRTEVNVVEEKRPLTLINETANVADLAAALNALGVTPSDLSAIFQQLQVSGSLHAHLELQ
jgi:flagellar P-ring protein precursor FlgI